MAEYTAGNSRLHMTYSFELLVDDLSASYIRETVETLEQNLTDGWPCWAFGNHDVTRVMSRWNGKDQSPAKAKLLNELLFSLRGSVCSYQGEELGLTEAEIEQHQLQDPYGITFWPRFKGRDGCRTPMPWAKTAVNAGFSIAETWLPVSPAHLPIAVDVQEAAKDSVLHSYREFLLWRKTQPALLWGDIEFLDAPENVLLFVRRYQGQAILAAFNLSAAAETVNLAGNLHVTPLQKAGQLLAAINGKQLHLAGYASAFALID